jgi:uncharacterized protein
VSELSPAAPTPPRDRIAVLDLWRGFALLGVAIVNFVHDNDGFLNRAAAEALPTAGLDWRVWNAIELLLANKFNTIFTLLFGMGVGLMAERLAAAGADVDRLLLRRMLVLLLIGWVHFLGLYYGELLHVYALGGLLLLLLRRLPDAGLVALGLGCALLGRLVYEERPWLLTVLPEAWHALLPARSPQAWDAATRHALLETGSAADLLRANAHRALEDEGRLLYRVATGTYYFGRMVLGYVFWRSGAARALLGATAGRIGRLAATAVVLTVAGIATLKLAGPVPAGVATHALVNLVRHATILVQAVAWLLLLLWLWRRFPGHRAFAPFRAVGRMSLSNYLVQSVVMLLVLYGPGLRLAGDIGHLAAALLAVATFALQAAWSQRWLATREQGPAEWLWRRLTYGGALTGAASRP